MINLSNLLSISRIPLLLPTLYFLKFNDRYHDIIALIILIVIALTDVVDGVVARRISKVSELGKALDPLADKICIIVLIVFLMLQRNFPVWLVSIVLARDILILFFGFFLFKLRNFIEPAHWTGKTTTVLLMLSILIYILNIESLKQIIVFLALCFVLISSFSYFRIFLLRLKETHNGFGEL